MVNKTLTRKKLNNEKGVTGVDIVVSVTMIVVTIAVVMAIFANISSVSRDINRTSGATRMATNILENIEIMYYEDFLVELQKLQTQTGYVNFVATDANYNGTYTINGKAATGKKIFKTRMFFLLKYIILCDSLGFFSALLLSLYLKLRCQKYQ